MNIIYEDYTIQVIFKEIVLFITCVLFSINISLFQYKDGIILHIEYYRWMVRIYESRH